MSWRLSQSPGAHYHLIIPSEEYSAARFYATISSLALQSPYFPREIYITRPISPQIKINQNTSIHYPPFYLAVLYFPLLCSSIKLSC